MKPNQSLVVCCGAIVALLCLATSANAAIVTFGSGEIRFDMEFAWIGNPGNAPDTTGVPNPAGSVAYTYWMGKHEVSRDMIAKANAAGNLGITMRDMTGRWSGGNRLDRPATGVSWNEAARFVNWLNISNGFMEAYKFSTQPGDAGYNSNANILLWEPGDAGYDASNPYRNSLANYVLPTTHEWYKAAYYDPAMNSGAGGYWNFATGTDAKPIRVTSGTTAGTAVYLQESYQGPADVTQAGGLSPFGTMGQSGNVWEWEESSFDLSNSSSLLPRVIRGGSFGSDSDDYGGDMGSDDRSWGEEITNPTLEYSSVGFRVVSLVPEPNSLVLTMCVAVCGLLKRGQRKK